MDEIIQGIITWNIYKAKKRKFHAKKEKIPCKKQKIFPYVVKSHY